MVPKILRYGYSHQAMITETKGYKLKIIKINKPIILKNEIKQD